MKPALVIERFVVDHMSDPPAFADCEALRRLIRDVQRAERARRPAPMEWR